MKNNENISSNTNSFHKYVLQLNTFLDDVLQSSKYDFKIIVILRKIKTCVLKER